MDYDRFPNKKAVEDQKDDLIGADLSDSGLWDANLSHTDLSGADLSGAYLDRANLSNANLVGANLHGANLLRANLTEADLSGANLDRVDLTEAYFNNVDAKKKPFYCQLCSMQIQVIATYDIMVEHNKRVHDMTDEDAETLAKATLRS